MTLEGSRKRSAPGASEIKSSYSAVPSYEPQALEPSSDQSPQWNHRDSTPATSKSSNISTYSKMASQTVNQVARRQGTNQMVSRGQYNGTGGDMWSNSVNSIPNQQADESSWQQDDEADLDRRALEAKKQAQAARKSIPPFVQKLSSFLDESRNTDLIRWSPKGDSFVVLDEDEFARTLIPELFKHNNYASFVRQLNMYGFHKRVGLSDNSMRASERKNKSPSEYFNPYFKRGKPNLLWLIQKPKPSTHNKKGRGKQDDNDDEGDEGYDDHVGPGSHGLDENLRPRHPLLIGQSENGFGQEELAQVHRELQTIRQQQQMISGAIQKIRREHEQLYGQAAAFQELHSRHENSINAILTFLATVYNRSLEGQSGRDIGNLFAGAIPHDGQQQGSVVDMGDYRSPTTETPGSLVRRPSKKQPLLLHAPPDGSQNEAESPISNSVPGNRNLQGRPQSVHRTFNYQTPPNQGSVEEIYDQDSSTPTQSKFPQSPQQPQKDFPEDDFMSFINSANTRDSANFPGRMDFPEALTHLQTADGRSPLSPAQRNNVLRLMAGNSGQASTDAGSNNALTSPDPPNVPTPNLENWNATDQDLQYLEKTLKEQGDKVDQLSSMLQPLSPSGSIPGLENPNEYVPPPDGLDFNQIFNTDDYFNDANNGNIDFGNSNDFTSGNDFPFGTSGNNDSLAPPFEYGENNDLKGGRIVETGDSSAATSPANTVEESITQGEVTSPRKRRRKN